MMQFAPRPEGMARLLELRARTSDPLDSELARLTIRAGIGLLQSHNVSFAYSTAEEVVALVRVDAVSRMGSSLAVYEQLLSMYSARLAVLLGEELVVSGHIFEFPDIGIARRAFVSAQEWLEEATPLRSLLARRFQDAGARGELGTRVPAEVLGDLYLGNTLAGMLAWYGNPALPLVSVLDAVTDLFWSGARHPPLPEPALPAKPSAPPKKKR